jgi:hypothetical protein
LGAVVSFLLLTGFAGLGFVALPGGPVPTEWNPFEPLDIAAPASPLTRYKLARATQGEACLQVLEMADVEIAPLPPFESSEQCHIRNRVELSSVRGVEIAPVETACATALRTALWVRHGLQPAAEEIFGTGIDRLHHLSSYNCREIRTLSGSGGRMSTHATADAIDITGVTLSDGRRVTLLKDWDEGDKGEFLRAARDSACDWFVTALGPDFNDLHRDHFHLQTRGWGLCR